MCYRPDLMFVDNNVKPHRSHIVNDFLGEENIHRMNCPRELSNLIPIGNVWDGLGKVIAQSNTSSPTKESAMS